MTKVVWTDEAISRLDDIEAYISIESPAVAKDVILKLLVRTRQLETVALSGREVPEYQRDDIRELLERPYRIIYWWTHEQVSILTVMHYRQLLPRKPPVPR